jgi:Family of unknown function (DUF6084)
LSSVTNRPAPEAGAIPELEFGVDGAEPARYAAAPTLTFRLRVDSGGREIRSVLLDVQIQIAARKRPYDGAAEERLVELFGTPDRWGDTLRTLPWARSTVVVPPFSGAAVVDLPVTLTYDLEVAASRYLYALEEGKVPLELLFSGTIFYSGPDGGLQTARVPWTGEAEYELPASAWHDTMESHFPNSAWIRLDRERFDRLDAYRTRRAIPTWDALMDSLLEDARDA